MKGKEAAQAARRRLAEAHARISELEATLSAERKASREREDALTTDLRSTHSKTVQALKVQRDEGLSPRLSALQAENVRLKVDLQGAIAANRNFAEAYKKAVLRMKGHFQSTHGLSAIEATEETEALLGSTEKLFFTQEDYRPLAEEDPDGIRMVQRARRQRS